MRERFLTVHPPDLISLEKNMYRKLWNCLPIFYTAKRKTKWKIKSFLQLWEKKGNALEVMRIICQFVPKRKEESLKTRNIWWDPGKKYKRCKNLFVATVRKKKHQKFLIAASKNFGRDTREKNKEIMVPLDRKPKT